MFARPKLDEVVFSLKSFAGAMLALYIALAMDLPRPSWAMTTAYIVAQPLSGAVASKAVFRVFGTIIGAIVAVAIVPNLIDAPPLFALAFALWVGLCLYISLLDRTPRSYTFMLAGYTAAIIGFPSATEPAAIFDTAIARVEEITLGILCATLVSRLVFPRHVGTVLIGRLEHWFANAGAWAVDALAGRRDKERERGRLAADIGEMRGLAIHLDFEPRLVGTTAQVNALQSRMMMLMPILSAIADRVSALKEIPGGITPPLARLLDRLSAWVAEGPASSTAEGEALLKEIAALQSATASSSQDWPCLLRTSLLLRLSDFLDLRLDLRALWRHMRAGYAGFPAHLRSQAGLNDIVPHRDLTIALLSGIGASLATLIACLIWWATAWPEGGTAALLAAVACSILAAQDDPARAIEGFLRNTAWASIAVGIYLFVVLPPLHDFIPLMIALSVYFVPVGILMARPATYGAGLALAINAAVLLGIQTQYQADFAGYLNGTLATLFGMGIAVIVTRLVRSAGVEWRVRALIVAGWREIAEIASRSGRLSVEAFTTLMLDRLGLIIPRLSGASSDLSLAAYDALTDVRIGLNVLELRKMNPEAPARERAAVRDVLNGVSHLYRSRIEGGVPSGRPLLERIDRALGEIGADDPRIVQGLVGLRRGLFPDAPPYAPPPSSIEEAA